MRLIDNIYFKKIYFSRRIDWFLVIAVLLVSFLLLSNLGDRILFTDEVDTVIVAKTIMDNGYPTPSYKNVDHTSRGKYSILGVEIFNWNTWIQYYIVAGVYSLSGLNEFWLRFPFVLFGIGTVIVFYFFALRITDKFTTRISTILLITSIIFLLHSRQVRWYSLSSFFILATVYGYLLWVKYNRSHFLFIFSFILLFYSQLLMFFTLCFALGVHYLFYFRDKKSLREIAFVLIIVFLLTIPWVLLTGQFSSKSESLTLNPIRFGTNFMIYLYYIFVLAVPFILFLIYVLSVFIKKDEIKENIRFVFFLMISSLLFLSIKSDQLPAIRYLSPFIPFLCLINGEIISYINSKINQNWEKIGKIITFGILFLLIFTNILNVFPLNLGSPIFQDLRLTRSELEVRDFLSSSLLARSYFLDYLYELTNPYTSADDEIIEIMRTNGAPNDYFVASYFERTLLLYTDMNAGVPGARVVSYYESKHETPPNVTPNWVIPRNSITMREKNNQFIDEVDRKYNLSKYTKIPVNIDDSERWADSPDPINHKFKTDRTGSFYIYHLEE